MEAGAIFPRTESGADPGARREFVQAVEEMGYAHLFVADHVLGADPRFHHHPSLAAYSYKSVVHEPLTLDQFIYAYARAATHLGSSSVGRHLDLPAGAIAASCVVFDEAHMYEPYSHALMRAMVEILFATGVPLVFMTATMPQALRADYSARVTFTPVVYDPASATTPTRSLTLELIDTPLAPASAAPLLAAHRRCLVVVNTVARAQAVYQEVRSLRDDVILVHSRFTVADRQRLEQEVAQRLGRHGSGGVVATQVCEAGLDISADVVLTELAPADALVQRAGRCARFGGTGTMLVYAAEPPPYEPAYLEVTRRYLQEHPDLRLADWEATRRFVDILPYGVDDLAASDSLNDLYDATLFAEARPQRLAVRQGKPLYLWVQEEGHDFRSITLRERLIAIDIRQARRVRPLLKEIQGKPVRLVCDEDRGLREEGTPDLYPFSTYVLPHTQYDPA